MHSAATSARGNRLNGNDKNAGARLGGARADFVAGLGRKVTDLRGVFADMRNGSPTAAAELKKKLGMLASSAKMMKFEAMERALGEMLSKIASEQATDDELEQLIDDLPALAWGDGIARSSRAETQEHIKSLPKREVLVVGSPQIAEALLGALDAVPAGYKPAIAFACETTPDPTAAYDLVRTTEPDLVVLDADLPNAIDLVDALMDDPLTETVPIVVLGSFQEHGEASRYVAMGVAKTVAKPMTKAALRQICEETLSPESGTLTAHAVLGEPTLEELADRLANEVREAIVGRADPSARTRRIQLGEGTEVLGAMWGAIARVREVVTARTEGAVRFAGGPEGAITPALLLHEPARADRAPHKRSAASDVALEGRRVVVADDDPAVVWFLADLLKTAGCEVYEAFDGKKALELAYESSPDLVISDILMPNLDGFSLCRAIRRDVALRDTPVILLSWKEDLLQRVRELGANASGYVRKESDTRAIIARVREALRGRARIETRLREEGEVRGRLDGVSIKTLLEAVSITRPDARISVRDATFLYEVEMRGGAPRRVTRTDAEGGFVKGKAMLTQMLGVGAGRFAIVSSAAAVESELEGNLASQLAKPIAKARAAISLLIGSRMSAVARVRFDEHALVDYLKATPEKARLVARRLANGAAPREIVLHGGCEPSLLDDILCDLAARGLVIAIEGTDGEDMLTPAAEALITHTDTRADLPIRGVTPPPLELRPSLQNACIDGASEPICASPIPAPAESPTGLPFEQSPSIEAVPALRDMFPFHSPNPMPPSAVPVRQLTPSPTFYEATGTPPAEQILALGEATVVENTVYATSTPAPVLDASHATPALTDEEDDVYRSEAIGNVEPSLPIPPAEMTPFGVVTDDAEQIAGLAPKKKTWPMLAFVTATGIVAWAVLHFTAGHNMVKQNQAEPPAVEMALPAPAPASTTSQDRADDDFYKTQQGEMKADDVVPANKPDAGPKAGAPNGNGKTTSKDGAEGCDVRSSRLAHLAH